MTDQSLYVLEREVEAARQKLAADLGVLRSPQTFSEFSADLKADALEIKDELIDKARTSAQSSVYSLVDDLKARAAANPAAVLAIGAGIAWRLVRHPPVATVLVGAGLYGLFSSSPPLGPRPRTNEGYLAQAKDRLREQASDLALSVKDKAVAIGEAATEKASELASDLRESTEQVYRAAADKVSEATSAATDQAEQWTDQARTSVKELASNMGVSGVRPAEARLTTVGSLKPSLTDTWSPSLQPDQAWRDTVLLGAAGVAVAAAFGVALQRRVRETEEVN